MNKKLYAVFAFVVVASVALTSTAYFVDTSASQDNQVTTGTFTLELRDNDEGWTDADLTMSLEAAGLMPVTDTNTDGNIFPEANAAGEIYNGRWIGVRNTNNVPMAFDVTVDNVTQSVWNANLEGFVQMRVGLGDYAGATGTWLGNYVVTDDAPATTFGDQTGADANYVLNPGDTIFLYFEFALENDTTAPQGQGETLEFDLEFNSRTL